MNHERCVSVAKMKKWEMKTGAKKVISLNLQQCFHKIHFKLQRLKKQSELFKKKKKTCLIAFHPVTVGFDSKPWIGLENGWLELALLGWRDLSCHI